MGTAEASPSTPVTVKDNVKNTTRCAESFLSRHRNEKGVGATFGYFTSHPVAPLNRRRLRLLLARLDRQAEKLKRPLRVLDLACGGGLITCAIAAGGHRVLGLDLSEDEIRLARLFAQEEKLHGTFEKADLLNDPAWELRAQDILGGKPDAVTLAYALHHLPRVEFFVDRLAKWLDPGAVLVINEENPNSPLFRLKHKVRSWIQHDTDVEWHRTFPGWKSLLDSYGFEVEPEPAAADFLPFLPRFAPLRCWSLVFAAGLSKRG